MGSASVCFLIPTSLERVNIPILQRQWLKLKKVGLSVKIMYVAKKHQSWDLDLLFGFRACAFFTILLLLMYFMADPADSVETTTLTPKPQTITLYTVRWHSRLRAGPWECRVRHLPLFSPYSQSVKSTPSLWMDIFILCPPVSWPYTCAFARGSLPLFSTWWTANHPMAHHLPHQTFSSAWSASLTRQS